MKTYLKKICYIDKLDADVDCSFLLLYEHSQFKFLCVITPQSFLHAHKVVIFFFFFLCNILYSLCLMNSFPFSSTSISTAWLDMEWKVIFMVLPR